MEETLRVGSKQVRRFHVNPVTGVVGECRAKVKCRFGASEEEHYGSRSEALRAFEESQGSQLGESVSDPLGSLPEVHRDLPEKSDGFYNVTGRVDEEVIDSVADYQYYKYLVRNGESEGERAWAREQTELAGVSIAGSSSGKSWRGNKHGRSERVGEGGEHERVSFETVGRSEELEDSGVVRRDKFGGRELVGYGWESKTWVKELTPREHNAVVYWTSAGSGVVGSVVHGGSNAWGLQGSEEGEEGYFDGEKLLRDLDGALEKAPAVGEGVFYRGLSLDTVSDERVTSEVFSESKVGTREWLEEKFPVGGEVSFRVPQSASRKPSVGSRFASSDIVLEVRASRAGAPGVVSAWGLGEGEYILPRSTKYRVAGVLEGVEYEGSGGRVREHTVVQLEQVLEEE